MRPCTGLVLAQLALMLAGPLDCQPTRIRAMVLGADGQVEVGQWAKFLDVSRQKLRGLLN